MSVEFSTQVNSFIWGDENQLGIVVALGGLIPGTGTILAEECRLIEKNINVLTTAIRTGNFQPISQNLDIIRKRSQSLYVLCTWAIFKFNELTTQVNGLTGQVTELNRQIVAANNKESINNTDINAICIAIRDSTTQSINQDMIEAVRTRNVFTHALYTWIPTITSLRAKLLADNTDIETLKGAVDQGATHQISQDQLTAINRRNASMHSLFTVTISKTRTLAERINALTGQIQAAGEREQVYTSDIETLRERIGELELKQKCSQFEKIVNKWIREGHRRITQQNNNRLVALAEMMTNGTIDDMDLVTIEEISNPAVKNLYRQVSITVADKDRDISALVSLCLKLQREKRELELQRNSLRDRVETLTQENSVLKENDTVHVEISSQ